MTTATSAVLLGTTERVGVDGFEPMALDLAELLTAGLYVQGNSGSGKSGLLRRIVEETHGRVQQLVIDAEGDYVTLAQGFDDYAVLGTSVGVQLPSTDERVRQLAVKLFDLGVSTIIVLSQLDLPAQQHFVRVFVEALIGNSMRMRPEQRHHALVVIDEVQIFAPEQMSSESTAVMVDLAFRGRKLGLHPVVATQRLSNVDKGAVSQLPNKMIGRTSFSGDQRRAADEIGLSRLEREALRDLEPRQFIAYGPALCQEPTRFRVGDVRTRMPKVGDLESYELPAPSPEVLAALAALGAIEELSPGEAAAVASESAPVPARNRGSKGQGVAPPANTCDHEPLIAQLQRDLEAARRESDRVHEAFISNRQRLHDRISELIYGLSFVEETDAREEQAANLIDTPRPERVASPHAGVRRDSNGKGGAEPSRAAPARERPTQRLDSTKAAASTPGRDTEDMKDEEVRALIRAEVTAAVALIPGARIEVLPAEYIRLEYQRKAVERVMSKVEAIPDDEAECVRFMLGQAVAVAPGRIANALGLNNIQAGNAMKKLTELRIVARGGASGGGTAYRPRIRDWVAEELSAHSPKDEEVDEVYQAVLVRIAGSST